MPEATVEPTCYKLVCAGKDEKVVGLQSVAPVALCNPTARLTGSFSAAMITSSCVGQGSDEMMQGFGVAIKMGGEFTEYSDQSGTISQDRTRGTRADFARDPCSRPQQRQRTTSIPSSPSTRPVSFKRSSILSCLTLTDFLRVQLPRRS
jgi:hypothetical protein